MGRRMLKRTAARLACGGSNGARQQLDVGRASARLAREAAGRGKVQGGQGQREAERRRARGAGAQAVVLVTAWQAFAELDMAEVVQAMERPPFLFDSRGVWEVREMEQLGFTVWLVHL